MAALVAGVTSEIKVLAKTDTVLGHDFVVLKNRSGRMERFAITVNPKGTAAADQVTTKIDGRFLIAPTSPANAKSEFKLALEAKVGVTIKQNPDWDDVKTDTDADGVVDRALDLDGDGVADPADAGKFAYNWATYGALYSFTIA